MLPFGHKLIILNFLKISLTESPYREKSFTLPPGYGDLLVAWAHSFGSKIPQAMLIGGSTTGRFCSLWTNEDQGIRGRTRPVHLCAVCFCWKPSLLCTALRSC